MPYNQINCDTFCQRAFGCSYYKEENNYGSNIRHLIKKLIVEYQSHRDDSGSCSFYSLFAKQFKQGTPSCERLVLSEDREEFEEKCILYATNLSNFFHRYEPTHLLDDYVYRYRIKGYIGCRIKVDGTEYIVDFSMANASDTLNSLNYNRFNAFAYNQEKSTSHNSLIYMIPLDSYYLISYDENDYTIKRGFISSNISRKTFNPGPLCMRCSVKHCRPRYITNPERISICQ